MLSRVSLAVALVGFLVCLPLVTKLTRRSTEVQSKSAEEGGPVARLLQSTANAQACLVSGTPIPGIPDCPQDQFCQPTTVSGLGTCAPRRGYNVSCLGNSDCLSGTCCNSSWSVNCPTQIPITAFPFITTGLCAACNGSVNCGNNEYCNINGSSATPFCTSGELPFLSTCNDDKQCSDGLYCDPFSATCATVLPLGSTCQFTSQCAFNSYCFFGTTSIQGVCTSNVDYNLPCGDGEPGANGPCLSQYQCDPVRQLCLPKLVQGANCTNDSQCSETMFCSTAVSIPQGQCTPAKVVGYCFRDAMCASGTCASNGQCIPATNCTSDLQCAAVTGFSCFQRGVCMEKSGVGSACYDATECSSAICTKTSFDGSPSFCMGCSTDPAGGNVGCGSGQFCNRTGPIAYCQDKQAAFQPCSDNFQCLSNQCDPASSVCNPLGNSQPCRADGACLPTSFCNGGICGPRLAVGSRCYSDAYCGISNTNNIFCDPGSATCAYKCNALGNFSCPIGYSCPLPTSTDPTLAPFQILGCQIQRDAGQLCDGGVAGDLQCLSGYCDRATNRCASKIAAGTACSNDPSCASGICDGVGPTAVCRDPCTADADCTFGRFCDTTTGRCISRKSDGSSCDSDLECLSGFCNNYYINPITLLQTPTCNPRVGLLAPCNSSILLDRQCMPPLFCSTVCQKQCNDTFQDCPTGYACTGNATRTLEDGIVTVPVCALAKVPNTFPCQSDFNCTSGNCDRIYRVCTSKGTLGSACNFDNDCQPPGYCQLQVVATSDSGVCASGCVKDSDCPAGYYCGWVNGTNQCVFLRKDNNQPCTYDWECWGNQGIDGVCNINGICQGKVGPGTQCTQTKQCKNGLQCLGIQFSPGAPIQFQCQQCLVDADCPPDSWCTGATLIPPPLVNAYFGNPFVVPGPQIPQFTCTNKYPEGFRCTTTQTPPVFLNQACFSGQCDRNTGLCRGKNDVGGNCTNVPYSPTNSLDCKPGLTCDITTPTTLFTYNGTCAKPCLTDFNCPAGSYCNSAFLCQATRSPNWSSCLVDAECLSGLCDPTGRVCRSLRDKGEQCNSGSDCLPDLVCDRSKLDQQGGTCTTPCLSDSQCVPPLTCSTQGACITGGRPNAQSAAAALTVAGQICVDDRECASGLCDRDRSVCVNKRQLGSACTQNVECVSNLCEPVPYPGQCSSCATTADCPANFYCNLPTGNCLQQKRIGVQCSGNDECSSQLCLNTICWIACTWSTTFACPDDTYCPLGIDTVDRTITVIACRPLLAARFPCTSNLQCSSGSCTAGYCQ